MDNWQLSSQKRNNYWSRLNNSLRCHKDHKFLNNRSKKSSSNFFNLLKKDLILWTKTTFSAYKFVTKRFNSKPKLKKINVSLNKLEKKIRSSKINWTCLEMIMNAKLKQPWKKPSNVNANWWWNTSKPLKEFS